MANQQAPLQPVSRPSLDARTTVRYALHARVVFQWDDEDGLQKVGRGHTRNISQKGAFVVSPEIPPQGAPITLNIYLPALAGDTRLLSLEAEGRVLRGESNCEPKGPPVSGFAVSTHRVSLSSN